MTLAELVERMAARLEAAGVAFGQGTTNALDEAAWLVQWRLGMPLDALDAEAGREVSPAEQQSAQALIERRIATRLPAAYLTGEAWLHGVPFDVDARTIIPRSLVAEPLLDGTLDAWLPEAPARVLDLCTGNGSLAVLAAMQWPDAQVVASDLSTQALAVAARNLARHGLTPRVTLRQGDALQALRSGDGPFDVILCNPPYVNAASMDALPPEFRAEPTLALAGGTDGMDFVRRLLQGVSAWLAPQGLLVLEIGHERAHFDAAFAHLAPIGLPTSAGDDQVLLLARADLAGTAAARGGRA